MHSKLVGCSISRTLESTFPKGGERAPLVFTTKSTELLLSLGMRQVSIFNNPVLQMIRKCMPRISNASTSIERVNEKYVFRYLRGPYEYEHQNMPGKLIMCMDVEQITCFKGGITRRRVRLDYALDGRDLAKSS